MRNSQAQERAITHKNGPCMVLAGPGSGKTFTITKRISYLISQGVKPEEILVVTFTKAAANEMKERFKMETGRKTCRVSFGTFHGIFYTILKWAYKMESGNILSEDDKYRLLKRVIEKLNIETDDEKEYLQELVEKISKVKNSGSKVEEIAGDISEIFYEYETMKGKVRKIDFDDMLVMTRDLFISRPDLLKPWQEKYCYILVDEFQDINQVQYEVVKMLALPENNLFVVGDDDQSIYGFRGSKPEIMLNFSKDFPKAKEIMLEDNYRSTKAIVDCARRVIEKNKKRYKKDICTKNVQGDTVHIQELRHSSEEANYIVSEIRTKLKQGVPANEIAVLFRSAMDARVVVDFCMANHIPFHMKENMFSIYEHFIGRDLMAYFRMAMGDRSRTYFLTIMNRPNRYLSRECVNESEISFDELRKYYEGKEWMKDRIAQMELDFRILMRMAPYGAIQYLRKHVGYDEFLKEYATKRNIKYEELQDILFQIEERAKAYKNFEEWFAHVEEYTQQLHLIESKKRENRDGVSFMTMHGSKGLEFDTVFIIQANEKVIPYKKAETKEEIEEERRLFYVAMTRAKRKLVISYVKERGGRTMEASRFIGEILKSI